MSAPVTRTAVQGVAARPYVCPSELHAVCAAVEAGDLDLEAGMAAVRGLLRGWSPGAPRPEPLVLAPVAAGEPLTARELRVLRGMAAGSTYAAIGRSLGMARDTAQAAAKRIFVKLGARDRASAVAQGYERGLLVPGSAGAGRDAA